MSRDEATKQTISISEWRKGVTRHTRQPAFPVVCDAQQRQIEKTKGAPSGISSAGVIELIKSWREGIEYYESFPDKLGEGAAAIYSICIYNLWEKMGCSDEKA